MPDLSDVMALASAQARLAVGLSDPNPRVGCVIVAASGEVIGQGHTQQAGGPHAEVMALRDVQATGGSAAGATAFVTLEPCAHFGRTPPCADALVAAGLARVVVALADPNPLVGGQGLARLRAAGIAVDVLPADHPAALEARELNIGFLSRMVRQRPWVRLKVAASLDGRTALPSGQSQWITSEAARADGHAWRARASAVLTGIGTVLADNPRLDVRAVPVARQPWRVVLDSHWRTPPGAALLAPVASAPVASDPAACESTHVGETNVDGRGGDVWVVGLPGVAPERQAALAQAGACLLPVAPGPQAQHPDLAAVLAELAQRGVNELHVEAGARLTGAFIEHGLADELLVYLAPKLLGPGRSLADLPVLPALAQAHTFAWREVGLVGPDVRLIARRPGADGF